MLSHIYIYIYTSYIFYMYKYIIYMYVLNIYDVYFTYNVMTSDQFPKPFPREDPNFKRSKHRPGRFAEATVPKVFAAWFASYEFDLCTVV